MTCAISIPSITSSLRAHLTQHPAAVAMERLPCSSCGSTHAPDSQHVYNYSQEVAQDFVCSICLMPFVEPYDTPCKHTFCKSCIVQAIAASKKRTCPLDNKEFAGEVTEASVVFRNIVNDLLVECVHCHERAIKRGSLADHLRTCPRFPVPCRHHQRGCGAVIHRASVDEHLNQCSYEELRHVRRDNLTVFARTRSAPS